MKKDPDVITMNEAREALKELHRWIHLLRQSPRLQRLRPLALKIAERRADRLG